MELKNGCKRVSILKKCDEKGCNLEFGTEIVSSQDGTISALLGASPGASVAVQAMINVIERCFSAKMQTSAWQKKMKTLVPSYGESLIDDAKLLQSVRQRTLKTLNLL